MPRKRKLNEHPSEIQCIGPLRYCPYAARSLASKKSRLNYSKLHTDSSGLFLFDGKPTNLTDRYELTELIGYGGFGSVARAKDKQEDKVVAIKIIQNTCDSHTDGVKEAQTMQKILQLDPQDKQHCARLLDSFCCRGHICLVLEEYGKTVYRFGWRTRCAPHPYSLKEIRHVGFQLCSAVSFLHDHDMTHNDVKPDNIMFVNKELSAASVFEKDNFDVRLIDFGSVTRPYEIRNVARTSFYSPPEHLLVSASGCGYDVWSIGCTLFEMYVGEPLFGNGSQIEHLALIEHVCGKFPACFMSIRPSAFNAKGTVKIDGRTKVARKVRSTLVLEDHRVSHTTDENAFFELLKSMLATDPDKRPCLKDVLKHEFFRQNSNEHSSDDRLSDAADTTAGNCNCS